MSSLLGWRCGSPALHNAVLNWSGVPTCMLPLAEFRRLGTPATLILTGVCMSREPTFASTGREAEKIDVRLSYKLVRLFSEGLYTSPNKAIEELVANSFDAG